MVVNKQTVDKNSREYLTQKRNSGRSTLLTILIFTVINIVIFSVGCALFVAGIILPIVLRTKDLAPVRVAATEETEELAAAIVDETPVEITEDVVEEESAPIAEVVEEAPIAE